MAVAWWPTFVMLRSPAPLQFAALVAHLCGLLAGYAMFVLIALMSRVPRLERDVSADVLARWHSRGGRLVVTLVLVHAFAAVLAWT